ncbi:MAG: hypothetical protein WKF41_06810 [Gaiellaceae bacterium]
MSDHMNEILRRAAGRGRFTVQEAEQSPASIAMNAILRGEQPPAPEPEEEPEPAWHNADASAGLGQSLPRRQPTMDDVLRGDHRAARRERQSEAETARLEREQSSSEHRSW